MGISEEIIVETETKVKIDSKRNSITLLHIVWMFTCFLHSAHAAVLSENFSLVKWTRRSSIACCWRDRASVELISSWNAWFTGCNAKSSDKPNYENSNWIIVMIHTTPNCEQIVGIKRKIPTRPQNSVYLNCRTRLNFLFFLSHWVEQHFFHFFTASHEIWIWYFFVKLWNVADRVIHFMWNPSTWAENECAVCFGFFFSFSMVLNFILMWVALRCFDTARHKTDGASMKRKFYQTRQCNVSNCMMLGALFVRFCVSVLRLISMIVIDAIEIWYRRALEHLQPCFCRIDIDKGERIN